MDGRQRIACWLALALVLRIGWVTAGYARMFGSVRYEPWHIGPVSELADRFSSLAPAVPRGEVVGYASPLTPADEDFGWRLRIARYTLAPLLLDASDRHRVVIADFPSSTALADYVKRTGGVLLAQPEMGLALIEIPGTGR